ncbi:ABC-type nitrate/sulfonate/bicarbonate transport system permease component [Herbaspirillum sp. Sphag1AN]|uniref:ABC transporter permease n=1 Tax=unclassified Herbaspirillum TaxID=2624150 RepID=UPI0016141040|nr:MULTISPECIES: ABC transporter permease [unclassified Herbaspirillum]MBB3211855.1 ABC-type nitrate/sulfonate/bicarbonate transport system permease component [Herbaspirillum sp. Sphag1AN]MBB3244311.1 ABC-type nitrate/sulfonate/bicarbonate transport system permease component [Herbaspirillum sp. Sphag64]
MTIHATAQRWASWASIPVFLAIWQSVAGLELVNPLLFPPPTRVIKALFDYLLHGEGITDSGWSITRVLVGYSAGAAIGVIVGVLTGGSAILSGLLTPVFQLLRPIPPIAFVPIVIVWFGLTELGKWFLVFWGVFFTVWLATHMGVQRVTETLMRAAQSLGASRWQLLWTVQLPDALPVIFVGLRSALSIAFYTLVAAELAGAYAGVAYRLEVTQQNLQIDHMMAGLLVLGFISAVSDRLFQSVSRRLLHWSN